jgi:manganese/zinc/iron transport system permease protein
MSWLYDLLPLPGTTVLVALGALALGITAGVVGSLAVLQSRSLVGDAIAHAALPGIAVAFIVSGARDPATLTIGAVIAAAAAAALILRLERTPRLRPDAAIGVVLAGAFSVGVVLLTWITGSGRGDQAGLESYLFGQASGIVQSDVTLSFILMAIALIAMIVLTRILRAVTFDRAFSAAAGLPVRFAEATSAGLLVIAVVVGLRMVGAILMVVMLIAPAVAARQFVKRLSPMLVLAGLIGGAVAVSGALASSAAGVPTGPVIALIGTATALLAVLLAPHRGVAWTARNRMSIRSRLRRTELLLALDHERPAAPISAGAVAGDMGRSARWVRRGLRSLQRAGLAVVGDGAVALTYAGRREARRAREGILAWSAWIEHGWRLGLPDAREADPLDLAGSLGDEMAARLVHMAREDAAHAALR